MEGRHAVGGTDVVGRHVVGTCPDELAGLDHQGLRIVSIPHVYADVAITFHTINRFVSPAHHA